MQLSSPVGEEADEEESEAEQRVQLVERLRRLAKPEGAEPGATVHTYMYIWGRRKHINTPCREARIPE